MDLTDKLKQIASRIKLQGNLITTEEATKTTLILPFIIALGYDFMNPTQVIPEFVSDQGEKKGEKVDYAILQEGNPIILIECKTCNTILDKNHLTQLSRYFTWTTARIGILTNGIKYQFYGDLEKTNIMDDKPFLELDLLDLKDDIIGELKKFEKETFNVETALENAQLLKYTRETKKVLNDQCTNPDEDFVRFFTSKVYSGIKTKQIIDYFRIIVKSAIKEFINEKIDDRLKSALKHEDESSKPTDEEKKEISLTKDTFKENIEGIVTTEDEKEGFRIVRAILREIIDIKRISIRDTKSYCGILLDDTNRRPICRLRFNSSQKYLSLFDENREEQIIPIEELDDIYKHADMIKAVVNMYIS